MGVERIEVASEYKIGVSNADVKSDIVEEPGSDSMTVFKTVGLGLLVLICEDSKLYLHTWNQTNIKYMYNIFKHWFNYIF